MNITFFIGNGFDLNLGLKTTYSDFLETYIKSIPLDSRISYFKEKITRDLPLWANAEKAFGEYTQYFMDVESFSDCHVDFCRELGIYLQDEERKLNFDKLQEIVPELFLKSINDFCSGFREEQKEKIGRTAFLYDEGLTFNFMVFNYTRTLDKCVELAKKYSQFQSLVGFVTSRGRKYENRLGRIIHVHGFTDSDMVLGVNDESQILNHSLFDGVPAEYIGSIVKQKTNQLNENRTDEKGANLLIKSHLLYIYGMSLGETDILWWDRICKWLQTDPDRRVIIHVHDAPGEDVVRRKYLTFERETKEKFIKYAASESSVDIAQRIHITGYNIFAPLKDLVHHSKNELEEFVIVGN